MRVEDQADWGLKAMVKNLDFIPNVMGSHWKMLRRVVMQNDLHFKESNCCAERLVETRESEH